MAPKKKNAFIIFCQEYLRENCVDGKNMSLKEATELAGPLWTRMSDAERQKYREIANPGGPAIKYTTHGIPIKYIEKAEQEKKLYERKMFENITNTVTSMAAGRSLQYLDICIFHFNSFCYATNYKRHYPAELAVAKFNLRDGVWDVYHAICNPGPLPLGYASIIQTRCDETHQLPVPPPSAPQNLEKIFTDLISFVDDRRNRSKPPPLYVPPNNYSEAREFLSTMCIDYGYDPLYLEVYSLSHLFYQMRNAAAGKLVYPSVSLATVEFDRDVYEYASGISCSVHEDLGVVNHCSKSIVTRMAYIICDNCCRDLNIELIAGKHVAFTAKITSSRPSSDATLTDDEMFKRKKNTEKAWSDISEPLIFSAVSDPEDDNASVASITTRLNACSLRFNENDDCSSVSSGTARRHRFDDFEMEANMSQSSVATLDFKSCSNDEQDKYFEPDKCSQESNVSSLNFLSQKTVCDYSSDDSSSEMFQTASKPKQIKGRGRGYAGFMRKK